MLINIIGLACAAFLFASGAEPIQQIKAFFNLDNDAEFKNHIQYFFVKLLNCSLCSGFWIGIIFTHSILLASIISVLAEFITRQLNN